MSGEPNTQLTSLEAVKGILDIPLSDKSLDGLLQGVIFGVEEYLLNRLRYAFAQEERVDTFERITRGRKVSLTRRPVNTFYTPLFTAKMYGDTEWTSVTGEVLDPNEGLCIVDPVGTDWPPVRDCRRRGIRQFQDFSWDLVKVVYVCGSVHIDGVDKAVEPQKRLVDLAGALSAYFWDLHRTNGTYQKTNGRIAESYRDDEIPPHLVGVVASLEQKQVTRWVA